MLQFVETISIFIIQDADKIFGSSPRHDANRIMWVFTDGDTDCSSATREMKEQGVTGRTGV